MSKVIGTGGAGFIGSHLTDALINRGYQVIVIDNLSAGKRENVNSKAEFHQLDLRELEKIKPLFFGVDFIFHLAAKPRIPLSIKDPISSHENNLNTTLNVLVAARDAKVKKVVYVSSSSVYGNQETLPQREDMQAQPLNPYALQKYVGELYCKIFSELYGLPTVVVRYFNVYGPRAPIEGSYATVISIFLRQKQKGEPLTITGDGTQKRDFTFVNDIVEGTILTALKPIEKGEVINIGGGSNYSINRLAELIGGHKVYIPKRPGEVKESLADTSKAKKLLDWQPKFDLEKGLKETAKSYGISI